MKNNWCRLLTVLLCVGVSSAADFESAKRAYDQKNYITALEELTALAEHDNSDAQLLLGKMYMIGQGVPKDFDQALKWLKEAALKGNTDAQFFVGAMFLLPQKDVGEGLKWLRLAADHGMQDAQYLLGKAYMQGAKQFPRDPVQGGMWLRLAAKQNKQFYQDELQSAERQMTPDQVAKAKALADAWKPNAPSDGSLSRDTSAGRQ